MHLQAIAKRRLDHVDTGLVLFGEQHPAVNDQQPSCVLEDRHVAADLAQPAQGHNPEPPWWQLGQGVLALGSASAHRVTPRP